MMIKSIQIEVGNKILTLSIEEARALKKELIHLFSSDNNTPPNLGLPTPKWSGPSTSTSYDPRGIVNAHWPGDVPLPMFRAQHGDVRKMAPDLSKDDGTEHF